MLGSLTREGSNLALVEFAIPPLPESQTRDGPAAASARFMAMLENGMTPETPAVWSALHRTEKGKFERLCAFRRILGRTGTVKEMQTSARKRTLGGAHPLDGKIHEIWGPVQTRVPSTQGLNCD